MADEKKLARKGPPANYRKATERYAGDTIDNCGDCIYMNDDGTCEVVEGIVDPEHVCDFYKEDGEAFDNAQRKRMMDDYS